MIITVLLVGCALGSADAQASEARTFWVTGTSGSIAISETSERLSSVAEEQRDRFRAEAEMSWDFVPPRSRTISFPMLAVPLRARAGSSTGYSEAGLEVRARIEIRASGETWVGDRHVPWSCTMERTQRLKVPVEVVALGGRRFELSALPATGFTVPASPRGCTAADPAALPDVVSFGGDAMRRALTLTHRLSTRELKARRPSLDLRQPEGEATALDCVSEDMPVCTQTARGSTKVALAKACHEGQSVVVGDSMSCDHAYPEPKRRRG